VSLNSAYGKYESLLSGQEKKQLDVLLHEYSRWPFELEDMWNLMDSVWDEIGCDNKHLDNEKINDFYRHPVWLINGLFAESHIISREHRQKISDWIVEHRIKAMLDYGGGFCTLSRLVAEKSSDITVDIMEPFPTDVSRKVIGSYPQIHFVDELGKDYACIVALDVLEHVPDPLKVLADMISAAKLNGNLLIGNCFQPVIKCHLPQTFHLHRSFRGIAVRMGLEFEGIIPGCHVEVYRKTSEKKIRWELIRFLEIASKLRYRTNMFFSRVRP
jgi:2-polyprenyl-6-hydroxyphenyl methylase/3-demethylubiquinone-9 3-methyltransferase